MNPPGPAARIHQHLDIGPGEVDWDVFSRTLAEVKFAGCGPYRDGRTGPPARAWRKTFSCGWKVSCWAQVAQRRTNSA